MINPTDLQYIKLANEILRSGETHANRTGVDTTRLWGAMAMFDLNDGFPLLTTKKMAVKTAFTEILGFVRGISDVGWYQANGCHIWDDDHARWHGPDLERDRARLADIANSTDSEDIQERAKLRESIQYREELPHSLGRIYGVQWRQNGQLDDIITALKARSESRRLIMTGWNYAEAHLMSLPPCHLTYHFALRRSPRGDFVDVAMHQRSADFVLGVPFNWANTALLTHLIGHATGLHPGRMVWFGDDVHIYQPHAEKLKEQLLRPHHVPPILKINAPPGTLPWEIGIDDLEVCGYTSGPKTSYPLFVG